MAHNVVHDVKANKLVITVDLGAAALMAARPSATGKTNLVASTGGSVKIDGKDDISFSLNVMQKAA